MFPGRADDQVNSWLERLLENHKNNLPLVLAIAGSVAATTTTQSNSALSEFLSDTIFLL